MPSGIDWRDGATLAAGLALLGNVPSVTLFPRHAFSSPLFRRRDAQADPLPLPSFYEPCNPMLPIARLYLAITETCMFAATFIFKIVDLRVMVKKRVMRPGRDSSFVWIVCCPGIHPTASGRHSCTGWGRGRRWSRMVKALPSYK